MSLINLMRNGIHNHMNSPPVCCHHMRRSCSLALRHCLPPPFEFILSKLRDGTICLAANLEDVCRFDFIDDCVKKKTDFKLIKIKSSVNLEADELKNENWS